MPSQCPVEEGREGGRGRKGGRGREEEREEERRAKGDGKEMSERSD